MFAGFVRSISLALAFAGLLQSGTVTGQQPVTPAPAGQEAKQGALATIIQSRSTNTRAYKVAIHNDGSATVEFPEASADPRRDLPVQFPPGAIDIVTLRRLLAEIGDVSRIQTGDCAKSASFGTSTQISYAGKTSGDLQCILHEALGGDQVLLDSSEELGRFVQSVLSQLKIDSRRIVLDQ
jgi:hypothetical protein